MPSLSNYALRSLIFISIATALISLVVLLWYASWVFMLIFSGAMLAIFLEAVSRGLSSLLRIPYGLGLVLVIIGLIAIIVTCGWLIGNTVSQQIGELIKAIPESLTKLQDQIEKTSWGSWLVYNAPKAGQGVSGSDVVSGVSTAAFGMLHTIVGIVVVLFIGLYGASQPDLYIRGFVNLIPSKNQQYAKDTLTKLGSVLQWWLIGQFFSMIIIGILTGLGLWLLGSPLPFALALLAFAMEIIPNIGPFIAAAPAILLAFMQGPQQAVYILIMYVVVQNIEGYLVIPLVQYRTARLPPAIQIIAVLLLSMMGGLLGAIIATPLAICVMVLIQLLYVENIKKDNLVRSV